MKKALVISLWLTCLVACTPNDLSLPELNPDQILITHIKEPLLSVIDRTEQKVVHVEGLDFTVHALAPIGRHQVALASQEEESIYVLDVARNTLQPLNHLSVSAVTYLFYDEQKRQLIITEAQSQEVILYDLERETELHRIKVGPYPNAVAMDDQFLYVLNGDSATVRVLDRSTYGTVNTFQVVEHPTAIVVRGNRIWVGGHGAPGELNRHVYVHEVPGGQLVEQIGTGSMPIALYTDAHNDEMYVLSHGSNELHVIDIPSMSVTGVVETGENPFYVVGDEHNIYVTALDGNNLTIVDRKHHLVRESYNLDAGPYGMVLGGHDNASSIPHSSR